MDDIKKYNNSESQKKAIKKYTISHPEKIKEIKKRYYEKQIIDENFIKQRRDASKQYYELHKEDKKKKSLEYYYKKKSEKENIMN
jgi:hypothetical protein